MKKNIPLYIHFALRPFLNKNGKLFTRVDDMDSLIKFIDTDEVSPFFFRIVKYEEQKFLIERSPISESSVSVSANWYEINKIENIFEAWINLLESYETTPTVFDNPILDSFEKEYFDEFEILEEDKHKPLENDKILLLDEYLENLTNSLSKYKTEENKSKIEDIQSNIILLQENLTNNSRKEVAQKISKIFAKIKSLGTKYLKEFITEGKKQLISKGVKFLIENGPKIIEEIGKNT